MTLLISISLRCEPHHATGTSSGIYKITLALIEGLDSLPNADSHSLIGTRHDKDL